jgi:hypothetical protein
VKANEARTTPSSGTPQSRHARHVRTAEVVQGHAAGNEVLGFHQDALKTSTLAGTIASTYSLFTFFHINLIIYIAGVFADTHE